MTDEIIRCTECKHYYAPVCTFHKWLPMTSRRGFCYHGERGEYKGGIPIVKHGRITGFRKYNEEW